MLSTCATLSQQSLLAQMKYVSAQTGALSMQSTGPYNYIGEHSVEEEWSILRHPKLRFGQKSTGKWLKKNL